jgi:hypothetical protein
LLADAQMRSNCGWQGKTENHDHHPLTLMGKARQGNTPAASLAKGKGPGKQQIKRAGPGGRAGW